MVDATDLKSVVRNGVGVRVPPRAPSVLWFCYARLAQLVERLICNQ